MILVYGEKRGYIFGPAGSEIAVKYNEVEVIDDVHNHKFVFTQTKDNGVQIKMIPYNGKLK